MPRAKAPIPLPARGTGPVPARQARSAPTTRRASDPPPKGEVTQVLVRQEPDLPGYGARLLDLRAQAIRPGEAGLPVCLPGRRPVQGARGLRRADPQEGDARHDRRLHHARAREGRRTARRWTGSIAATNMTAWATTTSGSCWRKCSPKSRARRPRTGGRSGCRATATTVASPGPAAGRSARSPRPGSGPTPFRRVFSAIGTYVGLRGGNVYPTLIRKYEPKPIRIFLQDGSTDLNIYGGDWWMANQEMERALVFAGYEVNHDWGTGGHSGEHATRIFPDAMRWLWKDWPQPVKAGAGSQQIREILRPDEGWTLVAEGYRFTEGPAANEQGRGLLQRHPQQQGVQDRPGRQGQPVALEYEAGQRPGVRARRPALRRRRQRSPGV